jgi:glycosyltransferase involved in cell wall biosynthesis
MRKRIIHIAKVTGIHGTEKHLLHLLPELNKDFEIIFLILTEPARPVQEYFDLLKKQGIAANNIRIRFDIDPFCFRKIYSLLKELRPGLVHTHLIHGDMYGIAAAGLAGIKTIVSTKHNDDVFRRNIFFRTLNSFLNRRVCRVITISNWIRHFIKEVESVAPEKIQTIYYGLAEITQDNPKESIRDEMGFGNREVVLGIIARLVEQKGHQYLVEAFSQAYKQTPHIRLIIVGDGKLRDRLESFVQEKKLEGVIRFTGHRNNVEEILNSIDIFVHPSLWEGFGLAILEAMAMGKPVIATNASAIPELVENSVTGLLVPPRDSRSLAQAIIKLSSDEGLRKRFGQAARERTRKLFSVDSMVKKTKDLYNDLLDLI